MTRREFSHDKGVEMSRERNSFLTHILVAGDVIGSVVMAVALRPMRIRTAPALLAAMAAIAALLSPSAGTAAATTGPVVNAVRSSATSSPEQATGLLQRYVADGEWRPCTAFVVAGGNQSVIGTAGHCTGTIDGYPIVRYVFTPGGSGSGQPTFQAFPRDVHTDRRYSSDEAYDFAFITVHPTNPAGAPVGSVVGGGLGVSWSDSNYGQSAKIFTAWTDTDPPSSGITPCPAGNTTSYSPTGWQAGDPLALATSDGCASFAGGASGGPWINSSGMVIAVTKLLHTWGCGFLGLSSCSGHVGTDMGQAAKAQFLIAAARPTTVVVDDLSSGFLKFGPSQYWWQYYGGYASHFWWTWTNGSTISNGATWNPNLPVDGNWRVYVFVPAPHATTTNARYVVTYYGGSRTIGLNQNVFYNVWVSLGTFYFSAGNKGSVYLDDRTYEACCKQIGFDAVQFVWNS